MRIQALNFTRQQAIAASMAMMLINVFTTRALLSVSLILFVAAACLHKDIGQQIKGFSKTPVLVAVSFLFFIPFVSGLWSTDINKWNDMVRIKLPLLFLPLAFAGNWQLSPHQWKEIMFLFLALIFAGTCWSLFQYLQNMQVINNNYLKAKVIPVPLENDHVRFSWIVSTAVIISSLLLNEVKRKEGKLLLLTGIVWFTVYLHILSARTGLGCFYLFLLLCFASFLLRKRTLKSTLLSFGCFVGLPVIAWFSFPTFQNRIKYFRYDFSYIRTSTYLPGANDGKRVLSLKAGLHILQQHPFGVGAGDVAKNTRNWYNTFQPQLFEEDKLEVPGSEWLIYGAAAGWPGLILFTGIMFLPFFIKSMAQPLYWTAINAGAAASFLFDIGLEVQFGVFLYTFIILSCWKWLHLEK